jgi:streptomycin 6-kinase
MAAAFFEPWLHRWQLVPDGNDIRTPSSSLLPVLCGDTPCMLKVAHEQEERRGTSVMQWYAGVGAARVLKIEQEAVLLERLEGKRGLAEMARSGNDDGASKIICGVVACLHAARSNAPPQTLVKLETWFQQLFISAGEFGGILPRAAEVAERLLADQRDVVTLHGDIHHGNILDSSRGWLAIDPKGLIGDRTYDYANIFCNPDIETATLPGRLRRQAVVVSQAAGLELDRLLAWILAYSGLSASWLVQDMDKRGLALSVAELADSALSKT